MTLDDALAALRDKDQIIEGYLAGDEVMRCIEYLSLRRRLAWHPVQPGLVRVLDAPGVAGWRKEGNLFPAFAPCVPQVADAPELSGAAGCV